MKTLVCEAPGHFEYHDKEKPGIQKDYAIIKIKRIGICGTDLHAFQGTQPFFEYPCIFGHELSGDLVAYDGTRNFEIGEQVTFIPYFSCGQCIACKSGKPNCCSTIQVCGVHIDGGMAEYLSVPSDTLVHGNNLSYEELALVEPLSIGAHGVHRAQIQKGETVLVAGAGPIGLGIMRFAKIQGAKVIAMDINDHRLDYCKQKINVDMTINSLTQNAAYLLKEVTHGDFPTVLFDATGSKRAINDTFQYMAHGARYVLVGLQKDEICFSHPEFHKREGTLMSSRNATRDDFDYVIKCMGKNLIKASDFITHKIPFEEVKKRFNELLLPENKVVKAMVNMDCIPYKLE